jgi:hypothetical protein
LGPEALLALADRVVAAVGRGQEAHHLGHGAHVEQVRAAGLVHLLVALQHDADRALRAHGLLDRLDRARATHDDRQHDAREEHHVAHRDDQHRLRLRRRRARRLAGRGRLGGGHDRGGRGQRVRARRGLVRTGVAAHGPTLRMRSTRHPSLSVFPTNS